MIKYLMTPFKGGLTGNIDTFIDQEVREMVNSIDKSRGDKRYECQGKKRKRVIDVGNVKKNNVMDYECDLESIHESNHSDDFKRNQQDKYKNPERKKKPRVTEDINKNDIIDYGYNYEGEREEGVQSEGNDENEVKGYFVISVGLLNIYQNTVLFILLNVFQTCENDIHPSLLNLP
ncbi:hypothetical protein RCL_jg2323.t1 [Rhizophagus clarus]|uniref:Uncharacterized protein n=1 Tax=Rhizophagus clarus TaxID=94130 RepID=A0A8H3LFI4_9GLOM|nr:hypothetical protein RCL_jg2323.t1 [Rhizophagus clarus]